MGPESKSNYILYMHGVLNDALTIPGIIHEITVPMDALNPEIMPLLLKPMEFSVTVKTPKRWRCRSRKRYIKLLMSEGVRRKRAKILAYFVQARMSYGEAWRNRLLHKFLKV